MITLSDGLGYMSMFCWLGAQFPQILENIRRQSCEGLALPFLTNWFLGDFSNLVGCILTHQLPFQTWLATYFVSVDCVLCMQYFYYSWRKPSRSSAIGANIRRLSIERGASRYRTLSAAAANVATTAALAAHHDDVDQRRRWQRQSIDHLNGSSDRVALGDRVGDDDIDESALAALADSFHSERGPEPSRNRVSWSIERHGRRSGSLGLPRGLSRHPHLTSEALFDPTGRGRSLQRGVDLETEPELGLEPQMSSPNRPSSRVTRRGATMVFLSAWALFGVGTLTRNLGDGSFDSSLKVGKVLAVQSITPPTTILPTTLKQDTPTTYSVQFNTTRNIEVYETAQLYRDTPKDDYAERIIGRIFAWMCTTLYLTSRLPQIWKNFVRKSVEGLSMFLFVFAFLGNTFYVASILSSPKMHLPPPLSSEFIRESIPYLLGSGGTLMFDIAIVSQSFIYRPRPRRHSLVQNRIDEEETGLLAGEEFHPSDPSILPGARTSRIRTGTV